MYHLKARWDAIARSAVVRDLAQWDAVHWTIVRASRSADHSDVDTPLESLYLHVDFAESHRLPIGPSSPGSWWRAGDMLQANVFPCIAWAQDKQGHFDSHLGSMLGSACMCTSPCVQHLLEEALADKQVLSECEARVLSVLWGSFPWPRVYGLLAPHIPRGTGGELYVSVLPLGAVQAAQVAVWVAFVVGVILLRAAQRSQPSLGAGAAYTRRLDGPGVKRAPRLLQLRFQAGSRCYVFSRLSRRLISEPRTHLQRQSAISLVPRRLPWGEGGGPTHGVGRCSSTPYDCTPTLQH